MQANSEKLSGSDGPMRTSKMTSIRVRPHAYIAALFVLIFFSSLFFYLQIELLAIALVIFGIIFIPLLAVTDRIVFNGKRLYRSGLLPRTWAYLSGTRFWLRPRDTEQVETSINLVMKKGGRVYFRYETVVRGNGQTFYLNSGGEEYRKLAREFLRSLPDEVLDANSIEIRDYAGNPKELRQLVRNSDIPSPEVLVTSFKSVDAKWLRSAGNPDSSDSEALSDKAGRLQLLGNQLKYSGSLLQALESFRRAAKIRPRDPRLLFDFARCLHYFALAERDTRLERKAAAMMRLSERYAGKDADLLSRLGETYFQIGEWGRAGNVFKKALEEAGEHFRSIRGMAELALRDGRLAHVVHNFSLASRSAGTPSIRKWSSAEADYFSRLNDDDEYLEMELGRVNLLDSLTRWRRSLLRFTVLGFPVILIGTYFNDLMITNVGWIVSGVSLSLWCILSISRRMFTERIAADLLDEE